jgi:tripartite-type tricarboxylate transporter receptor subunit TctC
MAQAGLAGQEAETLMCVLVPAGTPKPIIARLHREIVAIVGLPDVRQKFAAFGFDALAGTPEESAARIAQELARWGRLIRDANIKAE